MKCPIEDFALKRSVDMRSDTGREVMFCEISTAKEADPGLYSLAKAAVAHWPGNWDMISVRMRPVFPAPWGGAPGSADEYHRRIEAMTRQADEAGILGSGWVRHVPTGWVPLMERAVSGLAALMTQPDDRPVAISIRQVKEKFGTLRFYAEGTGSRDACACVGQILAWAEICSENRCMLTGAPGTLRRGGWLLTLSDDAVCLRETDPEAFAAWLYPDRE